MTQEYVIANWKMNLPPEGIEAYVRAIDAAGDGPRLVVAPPFVYIPEVVRLKRRIAVGAQNCGDRKSGAFTGEVSADMLRGVGATFVIVGHSERRSIYYENDALVGRRLAAAIDGGLTPVICIGEDLRVRDAGHVARFLAGQIRAAASPSLETAETIVIAYEPVWAIGTGRNASGPMVAETVREIREAVRRFWPAKHAGAAILYGGSVTPENVADLVERGTIDGFLVGGASLDSGRFLAIRAALGTP